MVEPDDYAIEAIRNTLSEHGYHVGTTAARDVIITLLSLPVVQRMEVMNMEQVDDPYEVYTAGDGHPAIRGRSDLWAEKHAET